MAEPYQVPDSEAANEPADVPRLGRGDFSGSGGLDLDDVTACALAWKTQADYFVRYPDMTAEDLLDVGDFNEDGVFDSLDIEPFKVFIVAELTAQWEAAQAASDPATDASDDDALRPRFVIVDAPFTAGTTQETLSGGAVIQASSNGGGGGSGGGGSLSGGGGGGGGGGSGGGGGGGGSASAGASGSGASLDPATLFPFIEGPAGQDQTEEPVITDPTQPVVDLQPTGPTDATFNPTPAALGLPTGPAGVTAPGAIAIGNLDLGDLATAPAVAAIGDVTAPGESIIMTGTRLHGANLRLWLPDGSTDLSPLRSADSTLQAVLPLQRYVQGVREPVSHTTALIAPVRNGKLGLPVRINAATVWWAWPCRAEAHRPGQTIRVFGKNLTVSGGTPILYIQRVGGSPRALEVLSSTPYTIEAQLPDDLLTGDYSVWAHNGTGGGYGWSRAARFQVAAPIELPTTVVHAAGYLAGAGDDARAIMDAIAAAQAAGGGTVLLPAGTFDIHETIVVPYGPPVMLRGAGAASWDDQADRIASNSANATILRSPAGTTGWSAITLVSPGSGLTDLSVVSDSDEHTATVRLQGPDQSVRRCLVVKSTENTPSTAIEAAYIGSANHRIEFNTIYGVSNCVRVTRDCDFVKIADCVMRGRFASGRSTSSNAVVSYGGNQMILERSDFRSMDRGNGRIMSRTCLLYRSSIRNTYLANNHSESVGPHASVPGIEGNTGEQYLLHYQGEEAGNYTITGADASSVTVAGGSLPAIVGEDGDWIVFIAQGRGAGQWREIKQRNGNTLTFSEPLAVVPQAGGVAIVQMAFRHNIIYGNEVDPSPTREFITDDMKTVGVNFWHLCFENIVANNTMRNISVGVQIAAGYKTPSAWNLVRDNSFDHMAGFTGGSAYAPCAYSEHTRGEYWEHIVSLIQHWITVGNIFRANHVTDAEAAANLGWRLYDRVDDRYYAPRADRGLALSVVENNRFEQVDRGLLLSAPLNWTLIRGNTTTLTGGPGEAVEIANPHTIFEPRYPSDADISFD